MDIGFIQQPQAFISGALGKIDFDSSFCTVLGINNLARCVTTLKTNDYQGSLIEFMKAAAKWTAIGTVCLGMQKLAVSMRPIYVDDVHERAHNELYARGPADQTISKDAQQLLDGYLKNHFSFKRWPQSGKDFVQGCLENNSPAAKANTRYFIEKGIEKNDFGLSGAIIKTCAAARWSTDSCLTAQEIILKNSESNVNKMTRLCRENQNDFCQNARNVKVKISLENEDWNKIIKDCVRSNLNPSECSAALASLEKTLEVPSKEVWETAKKVNSACGDKNFAVCHKAKNLFITHMMDFGSWEDILKVLNKECKTPKAECIQLTEKAAAKFFSQMPNEIPIHNVWELYYELKFPLQHSGQPSEVSLAMKLANSCISQRSIQHAEKLISMLEKCKDTVRESDHYNWKQEEVLTLLDTKLADLKEKLNKLPMQ